MRENNFSPRILYQAKLSFKNAKGIKVFHGKQKPKQYMTTKPLLQKILKVILHTVNESKHNHERERSIKPHEKNRQASESSIESAAHTQILKQQNSSNHHIPLNINN
jgi:hypothetical protein